MAKTIGFQDNLYRNGMLVIDAKANHGAIRLAHTIAFGNDMNKDMNKYRRWMIADEWYRQAISELPRVNRRNTREYRLECYIDYICFCIKYSHYEMAKDLMDQLKKEYSESEIQEGLEVDYIIPYRQPILDLL